MTSEILSDSRFSQPIAQIFDGRVEADNLWFDDPWLLAAASDLKDGRPAVVHPHVQLKGHGSHDHIRV